MVRVWVPRRGAHVTILVIIGWTVLVGYVLTRTVLFVRQETK